MLSRSLLLLGIIYLAFVSLGLPDGALGLAWPAMRADVHQPLENMGLIIMPLLWLSALSSVGSGMVIRRWGTGLVTAISCVMTALALAGFACAPTFSWMLFWTVFLGLGQGAVDSGLNLHVAQQYTARHMNWLHCFWGVGATTGPLLMTVALAVLHWRWGFGILASIQALLALVLIWSVAAGLWKAPPPDLQTALRIPEEQRGLHALPDQAVATLIFFLYSGVEFSLGSWLATVLTTGRQASPPVAGIMVSAYYAAIMGGRFLAGILAPRMGNVWLLRAGLALSTGGVMVLWASPFVDTGHTGTLLGALLTGAGLAPLYPSLMYETPRRFRAIVATRLMGWQVGAACLGGSLLASGMGLVLAHVSLESLFPCALILLCGIAVGNEYLLRKRYLQSC